MLIPLKDRNPTRTFAYVTIGLIVVNLYVFFIQFPLGNERVRFNATYRFGFVPMLFKSQFDPAGYARAWNRLIDDFKRRPVQGRGLLEVLEESQTRQRLVQDLREIEGSRRRMEPLTLLTCLFLHGSLWHVLANMLFLWVFGNNIEDATGHARFLFFYLICGIMASFAHMAVEKDSLLPTVGASGAISGVMGAYMLLYPQSRILTIIPIFYFLWYPIELPAFLYLGYWIVLQVIFGQLTRHTPGAGGVAWFAHIGGFFAGLFLIFLFKRRYIQPGWSFLRH